MRGPGDAHGVEGEYHAKTFSYPGLGKRAPGLQTEDDDSVVQPVFPGKDNKIFYQALYRKADWLFHYAASLSDPVAH
jgi:hypothetical protein